MALADRHRCKRYLKIRASSLTEDALIDELLASVKAMIETYLADLRLSQASGASGNWSAIRSFRRGVDVGSGAGTFTLTDLEDEPDYDTRIEPALNQDIVDCVAHLYRQRSPTSASESEGGGISDGWDDVGVSGLPKRVERRMQTLVATLSSAA